MAKRSLATLQRLRIRLEQAAHSRLQHEQQQLAALTRWAVSLQQQTQRGSHAGLDLQATDRLLEQLHAAIASQTTVVQAAAEQRSTAGTQRQQLDSCLEKQTAHKLHNELKHDISLLEAWLRHRRRL